MLRVKEFKNYDAYIKKQGGKITFKLDAIVEKNPQRIAGFTKLFVSVKEKLNEGRMLCLGARTGCEIHAANNAGFNDSAGVDLHPVGDNVIKADWHFLPFEENTFENVFTNSIDHCLDLVKLLREVKRVLKPGGRFFVMVMLKQALSRTKMPISDRMATRAYDALFWDTEKDLLEAFKEEGFNTNETWKDSKWFYMVFEVSK